MKDSTIELLKVKFLGVTILFLIAGGIIASAWKPEAAKDMWLIIGPIVSSGILVLAGHREKKLKP